jgi:hypothetical protein
VPESDPEDPELDIVPELDPVPELELPPELELEPALELEPDSYPESGLAAPDPPDEEQAPGASAIADQTRTRRRTSMATRYHCDSGYTRRPTP